MSAKSKFAGVVKVRPASEGAGAVDKVETAAAETAQTRAAVIEQRKPSDDLQTARDLEDAAMAYTEVVRALDAITKTTQAGEDSYAGLTLDAMADKLESAWGRWDTAHRRLIGAQRSA